MAELSFQTKRVAGEQGEIAFLEKMLLIRRVEEKLLEIFSQGQIHGTTHTSIGQEACAVGVISALDIEHDIIFSNHRCHGHFLAYGGPLDLLFGEVMGKEIGTCSGIGGSQHLKYRNFYSNGVLGGTVPAATGMALAEKLKNTGAIVTAFLGDGALGQGIVYETFNIAALWQLPILFVIEANGYAQSTPTQLEHAGNLTDRPRAFGIETQELQATSPVQVYEAATAMVNAVRRDICPGCLLVYMYRLGPHSKGDDLRPKAELDLAATADPLNRMLRELPQELIETTENSVQTLIAESVIRCTAASELSMDKFLELMKDRTEVQL